MAKPSHYLIFFLLFAIPLALLHLPLLHLPFYWDELGQFIPTALDLLRDGAWVAHSTLPNIHPPGVEAYLVVWYKLFGYSIVVTRLAMLMLAGLGLLGAFLLAVELSRGARGAPAFVPPILLIASPLFFMQSMMAQLDMPAMVFTVFAIYFFVRGEFRLAAAACVALVLAKESGLVVPLVFAGWLIWRRDFKNASFFITPVIALAMWLLVLHRATHNWFGNPDFEHYNVAYSLHPVRLALSFGRRIYYLFFAEFRWIGTLVLFLTRRHWGLFLQSEKTGTVHSNTNSQGPLLWSPAVLRDTLQTHAWRVALAVSAANFLLVTVLGGAELERYLLPVLPIFYIAVGVALTFLPRGLKTAATAILVSGLIVNLFWNPPYPFPYENNLAMVDFVQLEESTAKYAEASLAGKTIATAWPYTGALSDPDYGFVDRKMTVVETGDFHKSAIEKLPQNFDALIVYTRTWAPEGGVISMPFVRNFLSRYYDWAPPITPEECAALGLQPAMSVSLRGQQATVYVRDRSTSAPTASSVAVQRSGTSVVDP